MKPPTPKPCDRCPFRRKSLPGYLGASTPLDFINTTMGDVPMPCHSTVDYEEPDWEDQCTPDGSARHCAGAAIFFANQSKLSRDRARVRLSADRVGVFSNRIEFLDYHQSAYDRVMGPKTRKRK